MKRTLGAIFGGFLSLYSFPLLAVDATQVCSNVTPIPITSANFDKSNSGIEAALSNYKNYPCQNNSAYCLCFQFPEKGLDDIVGNLSLVSTSDAKPIYIVGLKINSLAGSLTLTGSQPIALLNSTLQCAAKENGTIGIKLLGDAHQVLNSEINNCGVGLQIGDVQGKIRYVGNNMEVENVTAHNNGIAFKVVNGTGNFFKKDSVYDNDGDGDGVASGVEGILLEPYANGGPSVPVVLSSEGSEITKDKAENAIVCEESQTAQKISRISFKISAAGWRTTYFQGKGEISLTKPVDNPPQEQGKEFLMDVTCELSSRDKIQYAANCTLPSNIAEDDPHARQRAVLLFHHPTYGSTTYSLPFILNPCPGIYTAIELDAPGVAGPSAQLENPAGISGADAGTVGSAGSQATGSQAVTSALPPPAAPSPPADEKTKEAAQELGITTPSGQGAAEAVQTGLGSIGAPGGIGGCGASLNPAQTSPSPAPYLFVFLPLLGILIRVFPWKSRKRC